MMPLNGKDIYRGNIRRHVKIDDLNKQIEQLKSEIFTRSSSFKSIPRQHRSVAIMINRRPIRAVLIVVLRELAVRFLETTTSESNKETHEANVTQSTLDMLRYFCTTWTLCLVLTKIMMRGVLVSRRKIS